MPQNPRAITLPLPIVVHILASFVYCFFGTFQFIKSIRKISISNHQRLGKAVIICGLVSAMTGIWMTEFYEFPAKLQGVSLYWTRLILGSLMIIFILWAMILLKARKIPTHGQYMIRAYAIAQGASTQAIFGILWILVIGSELQGTGREVLMIGSWVFNIMLAEYIIRRIYFRSNDAIESGVINE